MDRLNEDLKRTMQVASVIGRDFAYKILRSIMELGDELRTHLTNLVGIEVLYEKALYPDLEYIFKHALIQEVAYESLLRQRRREIHGRIAQTIEDLYADKLETHYELLAHHWELSDDPDRSIEYLILAGEKSNRNQAADAAVDFFTRALNRIEESEKTADSELVLRIREGRAGPLHAMGRIEESLEDYQETIRIARELGHQQTVLNSLVSIPLLIYNTTFKDKVPEICEQGLELARALKDRGAESRIITTHAYWRYLWLDTDEYETIQHAYELAEKSEQYEAMIIVRWTLVNFERWSGNPLRSLELTDGLIEIFQSNFNIFFASFMSFMRGWALTDIGKYDEAIHFLKEWIDILEQNSIYLALGRCYNGLGWAYSEILDLEKAVIFNNRSLDHTSTLKKSPAILLSASEMEAMAEVNLMENEFEMGKLDQALSHIAQFEEISSHSNYDIHRIRWSTRMKDLKGRILLRRGDFDGAEELSQQCLSAALKRGMKKYVGRAERLLGRTLTARGNRDQAEEHLRTALMKLKEVGNPKQIWLSHAALARLYEKMNRSDLEREQWQAARGVVESTADGLEDKGLRTTFINAEPVREIIAKANS
jgi:tetratricopeptide (TPR) repeat protein